MQEFVTVESCEGRRGNNRCGRRSDFTIESTDGEIRYSCVECVGRVIIELDADEATVFRVYEK